MMPNFYDYLNQHHSHVYDIYEADYIYTYGSAVYGVRSEKSDVDYVFVSHRYTESERQILTDKISITFYSQLKFDQMLLEHNIKALECYFLPSELVLKAKFNLAKIDIDLEKLRHSISKASSISFVKCKKKIQDGEFYIGKKSLFHSLRILMFGLQIASTGKINDYTCANHLWMDIVLNESNDWEFFKSKYQELYNSLHSQFKLVAPK